MTDCRLRDKVWASFHCSLQGSLQSGPRPSRFPALFFTPHFVLNGSRFLSPRPALAATATLCCPHARGRDQAPLLHLPHCCQGATLPSHSLSGLASPGLSPQTHWFHLPPLLLQHLAPGWRMVNIWDRKKGGRENGGPMARCCWRPGKRRADHTHTHTHQEVLAPAKDPRCTGAQIASRRRCPRSGTTPGPGREQCLGTGLPVEPHVSCLLGVLSPPGSWQLSGAALSAGRIYLYPFWNKWISSLLVS